MFLEEVIFHIRAATTKEGREIIIPKKEGTSVKEIRGIICLLSKGISEEIIGT